MIIKYIGSPISNSRASMYDRELLTVLSKVYDVTIDIPNVSIDENILTRDEIKLLSKLGSVDIKYNTVIHNCAPPNMRLEPGNINIGIVESLWRDIPNSWLHNLSLIDVVLTTSNFTKDALSRVNVDSIVIPTPVTTYDIDSITLPPSRATKLLLIPEYIDGRDYIRYIRYYMNRYSNDDDISLIIHSTDPMIGKLLSNISNENSPHIVLINGTLNIEYMSALYRSCDYLISPYRASSIDPYMYSSILHGVPVVAPHYSNPTMYLDEDNSIPIEYELVPVEDDITNMWAEANYNSIELVDKHPTMEYNYDDVANTIIETMDSIDRGRKRYIDDDIRVSIIVLSYNKLDVLKKCMESLFTNTEYSKYRYEIILFENGSNPTNVELFMYINSIRDKCRVIFYPNNLGFGGGNNLASRYANGDIVLLLNNDTEVLPGWLDPIVDVFDNDSSVGVVGSKLIYPNYTIQHAGIAFSKSNQYYSCHPYTGYDYMYPDTNIRKEMHAVTGACLAIRKELWDTLGGFDTEYKIGYYEDSDLCCRVRDMGYKIIYEPDSIVVHKHGSTFGDVTKEQFYIDNERRFIDKHGMKVSSSILLFNSKHEYSPGRRNIAIYNSYMDTLGGGEKVVACIAKALEDDSNVDVVSRSRKLVTREDVEDRLGVKLSTTEFTNLIYNEAISDHKLYDIFINGQWMSSDVGAGKYNVYSTMFPHICENLDWLDTYDLILANSEYTRGYIRKYWGRDSKVLYPPVTQMGYELTIPKSRSIISVGRFFRGQHCKNQLVMIDAFKRMKYSDEWTLHLVGSYRDTDVEYYRECVEAARGYDIKFYPENTHELVRELLLDSSIYWHATGYGASDPVEYEHFGIAPVEGISAGCYPILYGGGGLLEIAPHIDKWSSVGELVSMTEDYIESGAHTYYPVMELVEYAKGYSVDRFMGEVRSIIYV